MRTVLLICFFAFAAYGQAARPIATPEQSKVEAFGARSGTLVEKQFIDVGSFSGIKVQILRVNDLMNKSGLVGVRFSKTVVSSYSSDEKVALLDADEVDALLKSLELLKTALAAPRDVYTEIIYSSRGGFEAGAYYGDKKKWTGYIRLERYDSKASVFVETDQLDQLRDLLVKAKEVLK